MSSESRVESELPSTAPASITVASATSNVAVKSAKSAAKSLARSSIKRTLPIKRAHSLDAISEAATLSKEARVVKKPRGRRPKVTTAELNCQTETSKGMKLQDCGGNDSIADDGGGSEISRIVEMSSCTVKCDSSTQTDCTGCCPVSGLQKSLSEVVSENMSTFISTVSADVRKTVESKSRDNF